MADFDYPDPVGLASGTLDPLYGGAGSRDFGGPAWDYLHENEREQNSQIIDLLWTPYSQRKMPIYDAGSAGDVIMLDLRTGYLRNQRNVSYDPDLTIRVGILAEPCSAQTAAMVITSGPRIPPSIHGLAPGASGYVCLDMSGGTGRLIRESSSSYYYSNIVVGAIDVQGYVFLFPRTATNE